MIRSSLNGLVLEVAGDSKGDNAKVQQAIETDAPNQHWAFDVVSIPAPNIELPVIAQSNNYYQIRSRSSGKVLDVPSGSADAGVKIQQFGAKTSNNGNQVWQLVQVPSVPQTGPVALP
jgi:hypothetical protein